MQKLTFPTWRAVQGTPEKETDGKIIAEFPLFEDQPFENFPSFLSLPRFFLALSYSDPPFPSAVKKGFRLFTIPDLLCFDYCKLLAKDSRELTQSTVIHVNGKPLVFSLRLQFKGE